MFRLSERLKELSERLAELRPDHNDLFDPRPMSVDDISGLLPDESAVGAQILPDVLDRVQLRGA